MSGRDDVNRELNPYAPPAPSASAPLGVEAVGPSGLSTSNLRLARLYLGGALFFLTVGGAAAGLMRAFLWSPRSSSAEAYNKLFFTHGSTLALGVSIPALACGIGALLVPSAMGGSNPSTRKLALLSWSVWVLSVVGLVSQSYLFDPLWPLAGLALAMGLMTVHLGATIALGIARKTARSTSVCLAFLFGLGLLTWSCAVQVSKHLAEPDAIVVLSDEDIVTRFGGSESMAHGAGVPNALMALALGLHLVFRRRDATDGSRPSLVPVLYVVLGIAPALLFWLAISAIISAASADLYFHDTYFEVAKTHAAASVVVLAILAGTHAWFEELTGRRYREVLAILAAIVIPGGLFATTFNLLRLGRHGMPRRYASYIDKLEPLHQNVGIAAAVTAAGFALLAAAVFFGKRVEARSAR